MQITHIKMAKNQMFDR